MPTLAEYLALIPSANRDKPDFIAVLTGLLEPLVAAQDVMRRAALAYDLDTAVGAQLDAVGMHVGRDRRIFTPISDVFFSFDDEALGLDRGMWQGPYDLTEGITLLDDDTYRLVLRAKIAANHWDGTTEGAARILREVFQDEDTTIFIQDNMNMSFSLNVAGRRLNALFMALLKDGYIPLKPAGVRVSAVNINSINGTALFGFDLATEAVAGFDGGSWAVEV